MFERMVNFALRKPKVIFGAALLLTALACLQFFKIKIDTDPENMLSEKEFVRVFHKEVKKEFALHDYIVLGVVDEQNEQGVFNPSTLEKVYGITRKIKNIDG
ncbi:MAG: RND transporter, partial [Candidatus Omnitrophica bacterium]|nr:RND transporter [Candidatus Omnitrophota bacterium]